MKDIVRWVVLFSVLTGVARESALAEGAEFGLKVITHNVLYGFTRRTEPRYSEWRRWMAAQNPDIVSLQELNGYTGEKLAQDAKAWGHGYCVLLKTTGFPTGITSRYPITDVKRIMDGMHHGLLRCRIRGIWFYVIHMHPSDYARRIDEVRILQRDIRGLPEKEPRIVLAGDFNGFSPADRFHYDADEKLVEFFEMLDGRDKARNLNAGRLDYGGIDAIARSGFVDLIAHLRKPGDRFVGTFPGKLVSDENHGTDRRLDYIFVTPNHLDRVSKAEIIRDDVTEMLSDHIPVTATLRIDETGVFESQAELLQETGAGEGPAWNPRLGLLTSGEGNINVRDLVGKQGIYREKAGSNGLMFDHQGRLVICEAVARRVSRVESDGRLTVLADRYGDRKFNQPNDLTIDSTGRIYFSDPRYGDRSGMEQVDEDGQAVEGVYRIDLEGKVTRVIAHEVDRPNGLVVTPDDRYLYVADNNNDTIGGARKLWRFELGRDGEVDLSTRNLIYDWGTTRGPDGMKLDTLGRLYVAAGVNQPNHPFETAEIATAGIYVFSSQGSLIDLMPIPRDETTNCGFGGADMKTLFVTAGGTLWSIRTKVPGLPFDRSKR